MIVRYKFSDTLLGLYHKSVVLMSQFGVVAEMLFHGHHDHQHFHPYIKLYGFVKDRVYSVPLPKLIPELKSLSTALSLIAVNRLGNKS